MIGLVATALIQSSSTVTSIIVGLVAGGLPVELAIPMIMGANIGTTVTNTLVSLGHVRCKEEFKRAFASATIHDFFNLLAVAIFLPLEMAFGILEKISHWLVSPMLATGDMSMKGLNFIKPITKPVVSAIKEPLSTFGDTIGGIMLIALGIATIFVAITVMGKLMKSLMVGRAREILKNAIGRGPIHGIASGSIVTILVQSSSTTTSLMVPLVGSGVLKVRDVYPFTLGANIGTCITALLAATSPQTLFPRFPRIEPWHGPVDSFGSSKESCGRGASLGRPPEALAAERYCSPPIPLRGPPVSLRCSRRIPSQTVGDFCFPSGPPRWLREPTERPCQRTNERPCFLSGV